MLEKVCFNMGNHKSQNAKGVATMEAQAGKLRWEESERRRKTRRRRQKMRRKRRWKRRGKRRRTI